MECVAAAVKDRHAWTAKKPLPCLDATDSPKCMVVGEGASTERDLEAAPEQGQGLRECAPTAATVPDGMAVSPTRAV